LVNLGGALPKDGLSCWGSTCLSRPGKILHPFLTDPLSGIRGGSKKLVNDAAESSRDPTHILYGEGGLAFTLMSTGCLGSIDEGCFRFLRDLLFKIAPWESEDVQCPTDLKDIACLVNYTSSSDIVPSLFD